MQANNGFYGCLEMTNEELVDTDGGFLPFLIAGGLMLLASGCSSNSSSGNNNVQINCSNCNVVVNGDSVKVTQKK